jgi:hypothetical protein
MQTTWLLPNMLLYSILGIVCQMHNLPNDFSKLVASSIGRIMRMLCSHRHIPIHYVRTRPPRQGLSTSHLLIHTAGLTLTRTGIG